MVSYINGCVQLVFIQTKDGDRLADYLPEGFELLRPELIIKYSQNREVDFLAGGGYNWCVGQLQWEYDRLEGTFPLVYSGEQYGTNHWRKRRKWQAKILCRLA
jgi:acetoacetate decarboxylase